MSTSGPSFPLPAIQPPLGDKEVKTYQAVLEKLLSDEWTKDRAAAYFKNNKTIMQRFNIYVDASSKNDLHEAAKHDALANRYAAQAEAAALAAQQAEVERQAAHIAGQQVRAERESIAQLRREAQARIGQLDREINTLTQYENSLNASIASKEAAIQAERVRTGNSIMRLFRR